MTLNIGLIDGGSRKDSLSRQLAYSTAKEIENAGAKVTVYDQCQHRLPLFDDDDVTVKHESVQELFRIVREADVVVLSSPEYHNSMSSAIKNALDWLSNAPKNEALKGKVVGLIGGGGTFANSGASLQLMMAVRSMHGWVMPDVLVGIPEIWAAFDEAGALKDPSHTERLQQFARRLMKYGELFKLNRAIFLAD